MRKGITKLIKRLNAIIAPYIVIATYDGKQAKHYAWSESEAVDWMRQYPLTDKVTIKHHPICRASKPVFLMCR